MHKKFFIIIAFVLITTSIISSNAEEFTFKFIDSLNYTISYKVTNATLVNINQHTSEEFLFQINGTNGTLFVSLPKTIPILATEAVPGFIFLNGEEISYPTIAKGCSYDFLIPIEGNTKLQFIFGYWPERPIPIYYLDLDDNCNVSLDEFIVKIQNKLCSDEKMMKVMNIRDEVVCISAKTSVFDKLLDRGYLKPTDVIITKKYIN